MVGTRRDLIIPKGKEILNYSWNLGAYTNNVVESYTLWMDRLIARNQAITHMDVLGDSMNITRDIIKKYTPKDLTPYNILFRLSLVSNFKHMGFFHILQARKSWLDGLANKAN